ncbi:hypothetical protein BDZ85DRAFT_37597 [Elsinoe ampelina]|uniref:Uncharacterized protein n=1 Tax=Elsinoe ampelina TaxID=302913 RepID=A0A6A6G2L4_9PEZI|nr:hypothetical protein BDZ85DRAFT_37597 [Elsinoe ampelina]
MVLFPTILCFYTSSCRNAVISSHAVNNCWSLLRPLVLVLAWPRMDKRRCLLRQRLQPPLENEREVKSPSAVDPVSQCSLSNTHPPRPPHPRDLLRDLRKTIAVHIGALSPRLGRLGVPSGYFCDTTVRQIPTLNPARPFAFRHAFPTR